MRCGYFAGALLNGRELFEEGFGLRREVCAEMVRRREEIEPFIPGLFDAYVSNMSLEGIWGGKTSTGVAECTSSPEHKQKTRFFCNPSPFFSRRVRAHGKIAGSHCGLPSDTMRVVDLSA